MNNFKTLLVAAVACTALAATPAYAGPKGDKAKGKEHAQSMKEKGKKVVMEEGEKEAKKMMKEHGEKMKDEHAGMKHKEMKNEKAMEKPT